MAHSYWKIVKYFGLFVLALVIGCALLLGYLWYDNLDPQGGENYYCHSVELKPAANNSGIVVTAHNTVCDGFGGSSAIYVYVHKLEERESKQSLVFRYFDKSDVPAPTFEWVNDSSLRIVVGDVSQVTKQLDTIAGVKIIYVVGKSDYPTTN